MNYLTEQEHKKLIKQFTELNAKVAKANKIISPLNDEVIGEFVIAPVNDKKEVTIKFVHTTSISLYTLKKVIKQLERANKKLAMQKTLFE